MLILNGCASRYPGKVKAPVPKVTWTQDGFTIECPKGWRALVDWSIVSVTAWPPVPKDVICERDAPTFPQGAACGVPVEFDDGTTWIYPCWPEKPTPRCVKGCQ